MKTTFSFRFDHTVEPLRPYFAEPEKWLEYAPVLVERTRIDAGSIRPDPTWRPVDRVGPARVVELADEGTILHVDKTLAGVLDRQGGE